MRLFVLVLAGALLATLVAAQAETREFAGVFLEVSEEHAAALEHGGHKVHCACKEKGPTHKLSCKCDKEGVHMSSKLGCKCHKAAGGGIDCECLDKTPESAKTLAHMEHKLRAAENAVLGVNEHAEVTDKEAASVTPETTTEEPASPRDALADGVQGSASEEAVEEAVEEVKAGGSAAGGKKARKAAAQQLPVQVVPHIANAMPSPTYNAGYYLYPGQPVAGAVPGYMPYAPGTSMYAGAAPAPQAVPMYYPSPMYYPYPQAPGATMGYARPPPPMMYRPMQPNPYAAPMPFSTQTAMHGEVTPQGLAGAAGTGAAGIDIKAIAKQVAKEVEKKVRKDAHKMSRAEALETVRQEAMMRVARERAEMDTRSAGEREEAAARQAKLDMQTSEPVHGSAKAAEPVVEAVADKAEEGVRVMHGEDHKHMHA